MSWTTGSFHPARLALALAWALTAAACSDGSAAPCSAGALVAALRSAAPGDVVEVGVCRLEGTFEVPAGVSLHGAGRAESVLVSSSGIALRLVPGAQASAVSDLAVESAGTHAIVATGAGAAAISRVRVSATRGLGIGADGLTQLSLTDVEVVGPVTRDNVAELAAPAPDTTATHGVVLLRVQDITMAGTTSRGFAVTGALVVEGRVRWSGGGAPANHGIGLHLHRSEAVLAGLDLGSTLQRGGEDTFGAVLSDGSMLDAGDLQVSDNDGYGLLIDGSTARLSALRASRNGRPGLRVQSSPSIVLTGASELRDNELAGIVVVDTLLLVIDGAMVAGTRTADALEGVPARRLRIGDGIQLVGSSADATIRDVTLESNERVGLLLDSGGASADGVRLQDVRVSGAGESLGVIAQASIVGPNWDSGVTRDAVTAANDAAFSGALDVVGIVGPNWTPPVDGLGD